MAKKKKGRNWEDENLIKDESSDEDEAGGKLNEDDEEDSDKYRSGEELDEDIE